MDVLIKVAVMKMEIRWKWVKEQTGGKEVETESRQLTNICASAAPRPVPGTRRAGRIRRYEQRVNERLGNPQSQSTESQVTKKVTNKKRRE